VTLPGPIGIMGGTFDPIHYGHLRSAYELLHGLNLAEVRFIPSSQPPHRQGPEADGGLRLRMVQAAIAGTEGFVVDERELARPGPSYSVTTLVSLRTDFPDTPLCMIVGMDAFLGVADWFEWQRLFELAHIVVAKRPGFEIPARGAVAELISTRGTDEVSDLQSRAFGSIYMQTVTQLEISSTDIRLHLGGGGDGRFLLPDSVRDIIQETKVYARSRTS
jgi:nicotinate-nucleotide adenylyltransferase